MPWFWQRSDTTTTTTPSETFPSRAGNQKSNSLHAAIPPPTLDWRALTTPQNLLATALLTSAILLSRRLYKAHFRRIPNVDYLKPQHFTDLSPHATSAKRASSSLTSHPPRTPHLPLRASLLGICTSTHDPDNFRLYHTPLGRLAFWRRAVPTSRTDLKGETLHIRIAGIDAPELSHFGKPAQPFADESLRILKELVERKRIRVWLLRRDQYNRVVGLAFVRRSVWGWIAGLKEEGVRGFWRRDIGLAMLRAGAATVYEGTFGAEYGGWERERRYREVEGEARREKAGMWAGGKGVVGKQRTGLWGWFTSRKAGSEENAEGNKGFESPREYKTRMARLDEEESARKKKQKA